MGDNPILAGDLTPPGDGFQSATHRGQLPSWRLFETIRDGIVVLDGATARIVDANSVFLDLVELGQADVLGRSLDEIALFRWTAIGELTRIDLAAEGGAHIADIPLYRSDGSIARIDFTGVSCKIGGVGAILCNFRNITEYRKIQDLLAEEEGQFRSLVEQELTGIFIVSLDGTVVYINPRFAEMMGYSATEMMNRPFTDTVLKEDQPAQLQAFTDLLRGVRSSVQTTVRVHHRNGGIVELISQGSIATFQGKRAVIGVAMDITERRKAESTCARLNRALRTLNAANAVLIHAEDEEHLLKSMCEIVVSTGGYQLAWIGTAMHDEAKTVKPLSVFGDDRGYVGEFPISWDGALEAGQGPTPQAIRSGEVQVFPDLTSGDVSVRWLRRANARHFGSCISLPIKDRGIAFGALTIYAGEPHAFSAEEIELLTELGAELSYGVSALRDRMANTVNAKRIQDSLEETVEALAAAGSHRDPYTAGHQQRVSKLALAIGGELGLSDFALRGLHLAATIHDIGKICVPAEILSRSGKISPEEYAVIKRHADVGHEIVKGIAFPWSIADMVWQHHERIDGSGYPRGLKGGEILLEAKILGVADVVEAIMAHRPYRPALGINPALAEIERGKGTIYDPGVVDACLKLFNEKGFAFQ